VVRKRT